MIPYFDMFAGVGGFRAGLTKAGGFRSVGHCEIDKFARASYAAIHTIQESEITYEDARKINENTMPDFRLLCAGFPCQSFSMAGKRGGFNDPRGTLFYEIARVVKAKKPDYLLLENVPGLLSHDKGRTFSTILSTLCQLRYGVEWQILNSKDFGVPQARRRVYIVGYLDKRCAGKILPVRNGKEALTVCGINEISKQTTNGIRIRSVDGYQWAYPGDCINLAYARDPNRRARISRQMAYTLDTSSNKGVVTEDGRIRKLTPRECFRLQGFTDTQIDKILAVVSDSQAYKQAGNAVTVNVVEAIGRKILEVDKALQKGNITPVNTLARCIGAR